MTSNRPIEILLVEDNPGDVRLTREAFKDSKIPTRLHVAEDGEAAIRFLKRLEEHAGAVAPDLIVLDLNLPRKDGRQVLQEIKADEVLRRIPVLVLTTSRAEQDVMMAYDLHANCYIQKPVDLTQFWNVAEAIERFWLAVVTLPSLAK